MKTAQITAVCLTLLAMPGSAAAEVFRFDMGTEQSELRPGFTRVTARAVYDKQAGYGWQNGEGLREHHKYYDRKWEYHAGRGREQPPPIYTNQITCDSVWSRQPNTLLIDAAPGEYIVWLLSGFSAGSPRDYHQFDVAVRGGKQTAAETVKIPGPYIFERRRLRLKVDGPRISIDLQPRTDWVLAAVVVFPANEEAAVRAEFLDALEKEITFLPPDVAEKWQETKIVDDRPMPELSQADRQRGYAIFARHWSEVVYPQTVPRQEELNPRLAAFASLGEYEPVTFTVLPLADLSSARVVASDLRRARR